MPESNLPLAQQRILVTRPVHQQKAIAQRLLALGAIPLSLPTLSIEALGEANARQKAKSQVLALDAYQHVIFISTNAVEHGLALIDDYWPQLPAYQFYYAIGAATSDALKSHGMLDHGMLGTESDRARMNSEGLLKHPDLQSLAQQKCLIFRGVGGREHLAEQLRLRGAQVDYAEVYERVCPSYSIEQIVDSIGACDKVLVGSGDTLYNLHHIAQQAQMLSCLTSKTILVPSARVAALAKQQGFDHVIVSENASVEACIKALIEAG